MHNIARAYSNFAWSCSLGAIFNSGSGNCIHIQVCCPICMNTDLCAVQRVYPGVPYSSSRGLVLGKLYTDVFVRIWEQTTTMWVLN